MKNKRLIVLISIFAVLILIVILCSTLFTVKTISVNWLTRLPEGHVLIGKDEEITKSIKRGGSVFLYDKKTATVTLEEKYPYLNVVKIETKFPNKLVLHVADREEFFALKITDDLYVILDGTGKVLNKYNALQYSAITLKPICVEVKEFTLNADDFVVGKIANVSKVSNILNVIYEESVKYCPEVANVSKDVIVKAWYKNIVIDLGYNGAITLNRSEYNLSIQITKISSRLADKIRFGLQAYDEAHNRAQKDATIVVRELQNGTLDGEQVPKE